MKKIISIIISVIVLTAFFAGGFISGAAFQMQKNKPKVQAVEKLNTRVSLAMNAYGTVSDIFGRNVILSSGSDTLTIHIGENAKITAYVFSKSGNYEPGKEMKFEDIRKGQTINANFRIIEDGTFESSSVLIFFKP